jgi:hypothetical protein
MSWIQFALIYIKNPKPISITKTCFIDNTARQIIRLSDSNGFDPVTYSDNYQSSNILNEDCAIWDKTDACLASDIFFEASVCPANVPSSTVASNYPSTSTQPSLSPTTTITITTMPSYEGYGPCDTDATIIGIKTWDELVHRVSSEYHDANPSEPLTRTLCPNTTFYVPNSPGSEAIMYRGLAHIECGIDGLGQDCIIEGGIIQFRIWGFSLSSSVDAGAKFHGLTFRGAQTVIQTEEYINHAGEFVNCIFEGNRGNRILDLEASLFGAITFNSCIFRVSPEFPNYCACLYD